MFHPEIKDLSFNQEEGRSVRNKNDYLSKPTSSSHVFSVYQKLINLSQVKWKEDAWKFLSLPISHM